MLSATLLTKSLKTVEESALSFSNYIICLNKISLSTTLGDIKLYTIYSFMLIHKDIPIRNLKRNTKADGSSIILVTFSLVKNSDLYIPDEPKKWTQV